MTTADSQPDSAETRAEIFNHVEVLRWGPNVVNANDLFKQFFITIFHHYFTCKEDSRISPSNITVEEKAILEEYFLRFSNDMARNFTDFENSPRIRQIISGITFFRLELIPTYLKLFPTQRMVNIMDMTARFRMRECAWVERLQQIEMDMIPGERGPSGHFWWSKTFEIPEIYDEPADEYRLED